MNHYTYCIVNLMNGKMYVGKRSCKSDILDDPYMGSSCNKEFKKELKDHPERFRKDIISIGATRKEISEMEIYLHDLFDVGRNPMFYNKAKATPKGFDVSGRRLTDLEKANGIWKDPVGRGKKISESSLGKKITEQAKQRMREAHLGKVLSDSHKDNISKALTGRTYPKGTDNKLFGCTLSAERREALSKSHMGDKNPQFRQDLDTEYMLYLRKLGYSYRMIADICRCSPGGVFKRIKGKKTDGTD